MEGEAQQSRSEDPTPGVHLSSRQQEVLRLLVEGHSNSEIAAALSISPRTAANHVAGILRKFGVPSRAAAAAHAVRRGLA